MIAYGGGGAGRPLAGALAMSEGGGAVLVAADPGPCGGGGIMSGGGMRPGGIPVGGKPIPGGGCIIIIIGLRPGGGIIPGGIIILGGIPIIGGGMPNLGGKAGLAPVGPIFPDLNAAVV